MRLADYVVSYSLQINNRCLRYLAECDFRATNGVQNDAGDLFSTENPTVFTESLLARDTRRLASMWSLMRPGWKGVSPELAEHGVALHEAAMALAEGASNRRLALRLAASASADDEAQAILKIARQFPPDTALSWESLNELFTQDSLHWRSAHGFRSIADEVLEARLTKRYRKSYRLAALIPEDDLGAWLNQHGGALHRWVQLCSHQLELLRPGLSDKGKARLWYLDKMSDTLRTRSGLLALRLATRKVAVKKSLVKLSVAHIDEQIDKMDKRIVRLAKGSFSAKPKVFGESITGAVDALGLRDVSIMNAPESSTSGGTNQTTDSVLGG